MNTYSFFSQSGGEWISSIDLENAAMGHPGVAEAAAIGLPHPKWDERPLLLVIKKVGLLSSPFVSEYTLQLRFLHHFTLNASTYPTISGWVK